HRAAQRVARRDGVVGAPHAQLVDIGAAALDAEGEVDGVAGGVGVCALEALEAERRRIADGDVEPAIARADGLGADAAGVVDLRLPAALGDGAAGGGGVDQLRPGHVLLDHDVVAILRRLGRSGRTVLTAGRNEEDGQGNSFHWRGPRATTGPRKILFYCNNLARFR